jgi:hypothetical protein
LSWQGSVIDFNDRSNFKELGFFGRTFPDVTAKGNSPADNQCRLAPDASSSSKASGDRYNEKWTKLSLWRIARDNSCSGADSADFSNTKRIFLISDRPQNSGGNYSCCRYRVACFCLWSSLAAHRTSSNQGTVGASR